MEATGYYHYRLAQYLYEKGITVSVVNPLSVKRFIQMKLSKIKTDKSYAKAICEYAQATKVPLYTARNAVQAECLQLLSLQDLYLKQRTARKNKIHGEKALGTPSKTVTRSLNRSLKQLERTSPDRIKAGILSQRNPGRATGAINQHSRNGKENSDTPNCTYRRIYQFRECQTALLFYRDYSHDKAIRNKCKRS